jgi:hypothetical protein
VKLIMNVKKHNSTDDHLQDSNSMDKISIQSHSQANIQTFASRVFPAFLLSAIAAFLLHSMFEAWWVGVGSVQLPLFFIFTGYITRMKEQ